MAPSRIAKNAMLPLLLSMNRGRAMAVRGRVIMTFMAAAIAFVLIAHCGRQAGSQIPDLAYHRAHHAMEQGRWDWARVFLEEDLEANPDRLESIWNLGIAWISGHGGGLAHGMPFFERYVKARPDEQDARRRMIATMIRLGRIESSMAEVAGLDDDPEAHYLRALLQADTDPRSALDHVGAFLEVNAEHALAQALAARLFEELGEIEAAEESCRLSIAADPFKSKVRAKLERLLRRSGRIDEAHNQLLALEIVGRLNEDLDAARLGPVREVDLLRELEKIDAKSSVALDRRMAKALLRSGNIEQGLILCETLGQNDWLSVEDRLVFARILVDIGERHRARNLYEEIVALDANNHTAQASLAILDSGVGRHQAARLRMELALDSDPWVAVYHAALAQAKLLGGDEEGAIESWQTAVGLAPWETSWQRALAAIWWSRGDHERAESVLDMGFQVAETVLPAHTGMVGEGGESKTVTSRSEMDHAPAPESEDSGWWIDVSAEAGLDFVQYDGRSGQRYYIETTASGCGFIDIDNDDDLDVYVLTGAQTPGSEPVETPRNALFENRSGRFIDVTEEANVGDEGFGMGMCVGDVDGDGWLDFLVANYGPDRLYRNLGGGRFEEIAAQAGVDHPGWSSNCAFGDVDGDGDHDLYVSHYLDFDFDENPFCGDGARNISAYCRPSVFAGVSDSLFINSGDGSFREEGVTRGILRGDMEKGFGVVMTDLDDDADLDIFVANDSTPNRLYVNDGHGYFEELGLLSGLGLNSDGRPTSGMGTDIGDVDGDGLLDVVLTNYAMESNGLYRNLGDLVFDDVSRTTGLAAASFSEVGWGARLADFDNDGDLDLAIANGHVIDNIQLFEPDNSYPQQNRLLLNDGEGRFVDGSADAGPPWQAAQVSRALTVGDWNNDGRLDLLIANANARFELLENQVDNDHHWLGIKLVGLERNRTAIGAQVVASVGDRIMVREVRSGTGFQSQGDFRVHFGLAKSKGPVRLEIRWPDGSRQTESIPEVDRYLVISQSMESR
ncbi:MAG: hypothetical protein GY906_02085 [bacterium]|nr:hypothetical protein [bacterium]